MDLEPAATPILPSIKRPRFTLSHWLTGWRFGAFLVSQVTLIPLVVVLSSFLSPQPEIWDHLAQNVLP